MKFLFTIGFLILSSLFGESHYNLSSSSVDLNKECYTIEIQKVKNSQKNIDNLKIEPFPSSCINLKRGKVLSITCGCYQTKKQVILRYRELKKDYLGARIKWINEYLYEKRFKQRFFSKPNKMQKNTNVIPVEIVVSEVKIKMTEDKNTILAQDAILDD